VTKKEVDIEKYLTDFTPEIKELVQELRKLILEVVPDFNEVISWGNLSYKTRNKRYVCAISSYKAHVNLYFWRGRELQNPESLLQRTGKKLMHVKIEKLDDINRDAVKALVREAIELEKSLQE
jgi:hypothetical protein